MPRPQRSRRICYEPDFDRFAPEGASAPDTVFLTMDEFETIRLVDLEKKTHEQCAAQMDISRSTVTEIYDSARSKLAECLVHGKRLVIAGGNYRICDGSAAGRCGRSCSRGASPEEIYVDLPLKGVLTMRIAVTYENGQVYQHFGHTQQFKVYDVVDGVITQEAVVDTNGAGHGALAGFLLGGQVDVLICGGIGGGAQNALAQAGIKLYGGVQGSADEAVKAFLSGNLGYNPNVQCNHHGHDHGEGGCGHSCH